MREAYWANHDAAISGRTLLDINLPEHAQESHVRHCIDLLRQTLMCHPDTTVEVADPETDGVAGFGVTHVCRSYEELRKWTVQHQVEK